MIKQVVSIVALGVALCGCATAESARPQQATLRNAVFVTGGKGAVVQSAAGGNETDADAQPGASKMVRVYWFLAGR